MTSHTGRLYAAAFALLAFFLAWATIAAHPWASAAPDRRLQALAARERLLRSDAKLVDAIVAQRTAVYRARLRARSAQVAAAKAPPSARPAASRPVRIVTLPPLTITRTS